MEYFPFLFRIRAITNIFLRKRARFQYANVLMTSDVELCSVLVSNKKIVYFERGARSQGYFTKDHKIK